MFIFLIMVSIFLQQNQVSCKHDGKEFVARYKKDTGVWDICMKQPVCSGFIGMLKYEERSQGGPSYVMGFDGVKGPLQFNAKVNPASGQMKKSYLYNASDLAKGVKLAMDCKVFICFYLPFFYSIQALATHNGRARRRLGACRRSPERMGCVVVV